MCYHRVIERLFRVLGVRIVRIVFACLDPRRSCVMVDPVH